MGQACTQKGTVEGPNTELVDGKTEGGAEDAGEANPADLLGTSPESENPVVQLTPQSGALRVDDILADTATPQASSPPPQTSSASSASPEPDSTQKASEQEPEDEEPQDSVWQSLTKLVNDINGKPENRKEDAVSSTPPAEGAANPDDANAGSTDDLLASSNDLLASSDALLASTNAVSSTSLPSLSTAASPERSAAASSPGGVAGPASTTDADALGAELAAIEIPALSSNQPPSTAPKPSNQNAPSGPSSAAASSAASSLAKIEAMTKVMPPQTNKFASPIAAVPAVTEAAQQRAQLVFQDLSRDFGQDAVNKTVEEVAKNALSRDRLQVVLDQSNGVRLTCDQLKSLVDMVTLDAHKKQIIFGRYAQLSDKEKFHEVIVENYTRSTSLRKAIVEELNAALCKDATSV